MSGPLDDYASEVAAGMLKGTGDVARSAVADIGNSYQQILMSDASISPSAGLSGAVETVAVEATPAAEPPVLESIPEPPKPEVDVET